MLYNVQVTWRYVTQYIFTLTEFSNAVRGSIPGSVAVTLVLVVPLTDRPISGHCLLMSGPES